MWETAETAYDSWKVTFAKHQRLIELAGKLWWPNTHQTRTLNDLAYRLFDHQHETILVLLSKGEGLSFNPADSKAAKEALLLMPSKAEWDQLQAFVRKWGPYY